MIVIVSCQSSSLSVDRAIGSPRGWSPSRGPPKPPGTDHGQHDEERRHQDRPDPEQGAPWELPASRSQPHGGGGTLGIPPRLLLVEDVREIPSGHLAVFGLVGDLEIGAVEVGEQLLRPRRPNSGSSWK